MNREDCEKLLAAYRESVTTGCDSAAQMLFEVIVNIMAGSKYNSGTLRVDGRGITLPQHFTVPCEQVSKTEATWVGAE